MKSAKNPVRYLPERERSWHNISCHNALDNDGALSLGWGNIQASYASYLEILVSSGQ
jgi:hypothetical protein